METASSEITFVTLTLAIASFVVCESEDVEKIQERLQEEQLLGDARCKIDFLEAEYWAIAPKYECWENHTRKHLENVYEKFPEVVKTKIQQFKNVSEENFEKIHPTTRFHKWVYIVVHVMEPRVQHLRNRLGNFRRICSFCANIVSLRQTLSIYTTYRYISTNSTLELEPADIQNIQVILKKNFGKDNDTIDDLGLLFFQEVAKKDDKDTDEDYSIEAIRITVRNRNTGGNSQNQFKSGKFKPTKNVENPKQ